MYLYILSMCISLQCLHRISITIRYRLQAEIRDAFLSRGLYRTPAEMQLQLHGLRRVESQSIFISSFALPNCSSYVILIADNHRQITYHNHHTSRCDAAPRVVEDKSSGKWPAPTACIPSHTWRGRIVSKQVTSTRCRVAHGYLSMTTLFYSRYAYTEPAVGVKQCHGIV